MLPARNVADLATLLEGFVSEILGRRQFASPFMFMRRGLTSSYPESGGSNGTRTVRDSPLPFSWYVMSIPYPATHYQHAVSPKGITRSAMKEGKERENARWCQCQSSSRWRPAR